MNNFYDDEEQNIFMRRKSAIESSRVRSVHYPFGGSKLSSSVVLDNSAEDQLFKAWKRMDAKSEESDGFCGREGDVTFSTLSQRKYIAPLHLPRTLRSSPQLQLVSSSALRSDAFAADSFSRHPWPHETRTYPYLGDEHHLKRFPPITSIDTPEDKALQLRSICLENSRDIPEPVTFKTNNSLKRREASQSHPIVEDGTALKTKDLEKRCDSRLSSGLTKARQLKKGESFKVVFEMETFKKYQKLVARTVLSSN